MSSRVCLNRHKTVFLHQGQPPAATLLSTAMLTDTPLIILLAVPFSSHRLGWLCVGCWGQLSDVRELKRDVVCNPLNAGCPDGQRNDGRPTSGGAAYPLVGKVSKISDITQQGRYALLTCHFGFMIGGLINVGLYIPCVVGGANCHVRTVRMLEAQSCPS